MAKTYNGKKVAVIWGAIIFQGLAQDGDAISVTFDEDHVTKAVGMDGEVARAMNANRTGKITVRLMATSLTNQLLSAAKELDAASGTAYYPLTVKDASGLDIHFAKEAWILKTPDSSYSKEIGIREWVFDCGQLISNPGGISG